MKIFGWIIPILGLLGCIWAGVVGTLTAGSEHQGVGAIAIAIAAVGGLFAGIRLI
jgi:hypothetical protein